MIRKSGGCVLSFSCFFTLFGLFVVPNHERENLGCSDPRLSFTGGQNDLVVPIHRISIGHRNKSMISEHPPFVRQSIVGKDAIVEMEFRICEVIINSTVKSLVLFTIAKLFCYLSCSDDL